MQSTLGIATTLYRRCRQIFRQVFALEVLSNGALLVVDGNICTFNSDELFGFIWTALIALRSEFTKLLSTIFEQFNYLNYQTLFRIRNFRFQRNYKNSNKQIRIKALAEIQLGFLTIQRNTFGSSLIPNFKV